GWKEVAIGNLCIRVNAGGTPNRKKTEYWDKHEVKWFKTKELQDCWLFDAEEYISEKGLNNSSAKIFPENTILMAIYASPTLGRLGILTDDACCNQAALCMIADEEKISYQWLYLKLMELRDYFNSVARGAGQQNISGDVVKNKIVLVPEKKLMEEFTSITKPYFNKIKNCQLSIVNLKSARDKLLPKLMNGEFEV
ncbi:MAG: restriction endonuclease subunit S, partial [Treponema sp.]|nr:restriction endonuclease subunit S [Treponema sp.]